MYEQLDDIPFGPDGTVSAVVQDARDGTVFMLVEMNREALAATLRSGVLYAWKRSAQDLYQPGEETGQTASVAAIKYGGAALLIHVSPTSGGGGLESHFDRALAPPRGFAGDASPSVAQMPAALYDLILRRRASGDDKSYVQGLFRRGQDVICKKVAEEAAEVVIASKNQTPAEIIYEMADLWFHATVLLGYHHIHPHEVWRELQRRFGQPGGGKAPAAEAPPAPPEPTSG